MKFALLYIVLLTQTLGNYVTAQIPNGGFEDWEVINNIEGPSLWTYSPNNPNSPKIVKSLEAVEGAYSLKLNSTSGGWDCHSRTFIIIELDSMVGPNQTISFYLKTIKHPSNQTDRVYLRFTFNLRSGDDYRPGYQWINTYETHDFIRHQTPVIDSTVNKIAIEIQGGGFFGPNDSCNARCISWIDGMKIGDQLAPELLEYEDLHGLFSKNEEISSSQQVARIYPNPVSEFINIVSEFDLKKARIFNVLGQEVLHRNVKAGQEKIYVGDLNRGSYFIRLELNNQSVVKRFFKL